MDWYWDALIWIVHNFGVILFFLFIIIALIISFAIPTRELLGMAPKKSDSEQGEE